jgi:hypothetical protein
MPPRNPNALSFERRECPRTVASADERRLSPTFRLAAFGPISDRVSQNKPRLPHRKRGTAYAAGLKRCARCAKNSVRREFRLAVSSIARRTAETRRCGDRDQPDIGVWATLWHPVKRFCNTSMRFLIARKRPTTLWRRTHESFVCIGHYRRRIDRARNQQCSSPGRLDRGMQRWHIYVGRIETRRLRWARWCKDLE